MTTAAPFSIDELLRRVKELDASDLHLTPGSEPVVRVRGQLERLGEYETLSPETVRDPGRDQVARGAGHALASRRPRVDPARPRARHRADRLGQVDDARDADRHDQ